MDDPTQRNSPDSKRINVDEKHEVSYWTATLNVSEEKLRAAVRAVGTSVEKVRAHLGK